MEKFPVADHILRLSSPRLPRRQLDLAITVLLLQGSGRTAFVGYQGLRRNLYSIDHRFVVRLLESTRAKVVRTAIVATPAFASLPRSVYHRLFYRYWRLNRRDVSWRRALGWSLGPFLMTNSQEGPLFAKPIWSMAMDADDEIASHAIYQTQYLLDALTLQQCEALIDLTHHDSNRAGTAMSSLGGLYKHLRSLRPEVRALLLDARTIATLRSAHPPDGRDKASCYGWCMAQMRTALARSRRGRVPRAVK